MKLIDAIRDLDSFVETSTIYATSPWTGDSAVVIDTEPDDGRLPDSARAINARYFLEVFVATEFLTDWQSSVGVQPLEVQCQRLIQYAESDA